MLSHGKKRPTTFIAHIFEPFTFEAAVTQEHIEAEPASASPAHSVGMLPVEVTCQAVEAVIPESDRVLLGLPRKGRLLVLEALFLKRINSRRNRHSNIHALKIPIKVDCIPEDRRPKT